MLQEVDWKEGPEWHDWPDCWDWQLVECLIGSIYFGAQTFHLGGLEGPFWWVAWRVVFGVPSDLFGGSGSPETLHRSPLGPNLDFYRFGMESGSPLGVTLM